MKLTNKLTPIALAVSMAAGAALPSMASAEVGYNATVSSMYLWRGQDVSNGPTVSGGIDYSHDSGVYASAWASSGVNGTNGLELEDNDTPDDSTDDTVIAGGNGYELDLWVGYAGEIEGVGYDISYWIIDYPQTTLDSFSEISLGLSFMDFSFGYTVSGESDNDYSYTTLGYSYDAFGFTYGMADNGESGAAESAYSHFGISYAATDALSFTISKASDDTAGVSEEELIMVSYSLPL